MTLRPYSSLARFTASTWLLASLLSGGFISRMPHYDACVDSTIG